MKIVILDAATLTINNDIDFSIFDRFGEVKIYDFTKDEEIPERIKDADVILCNKSSMSEKNLSGAKNLKYVGLFATGYNNVDLEYTRKKGITVCNAGSYSTEAVAQHVFAFILHYYNTISRYDEFVKNKGWINTNKFSPFMEMKELFGKTIGIIGYGSIGQKVAVIANAFGMNVLAYSRSALKENRQSDKVTYATVDEILDKAREKGESPFVILLDDIEDPHNLGAIIRTANLAGAHGVIIPKHRASGLTATVAKHQQAH